MPEENGKTIVSGSQSPNPDFGSVPGDISPENLVFLRGMIDSFNASTARLQAAYDTLRKKVESLNLELEKKNRDLSASLAEQERLSNYLTNILESLSSGVLVIDCNGYITLFNKGAESITGVAVKDALNRRYREIMGDEAPDNMTPLGALTTGGLAQFEKTIRLRKGGSVPVGCSLSTLINTSGEMIGAVEIFMDLSRIKELEEELARKEKLAALGQMAATMAHKIRNPLGGIAGFAGLLDLDLKDSQNGRRLVGKITEGVDKLERIVTNLLSYTAPLTIEYRITDMVAIMKESAVSVSAGDQGSPMHFRFPDGQVMAEIDVERFRKVAVSIIRNAVEAVADGGEVTVIVGDEGTDFGEIDACTKRVIDRINHDSNRPHHHSDRAVIIIADTGAGMDDKTIEQLFVPFYTTKENGIGLGLAYAGKIIEGHRGVILIESDEGKGTAVGIAIPKRKAV